jgi:hypothetical protein
LSYFTFYRFTFHLAFAALLAISLRRFADSPSARAFPPRAPAYSSAFYNSCFTPSALSKKFEHNRRALALVAPVLINMPGPRPD